MNKIFTILVLFAIAAGFIFNRSAAMSAAILSLPGRVLELTIAIVANACLWNGLLELGKASGLIFRISKFFNPILKKIFPEIKENHEVMALISSNFIANFLGLGNLAMISGLKAMKALDQLNLEKKKASRSMKTLIIFNTTGCSILPMSIVALRSNFCSNDPLGFAGYTFLIGLITLTVGIIIQKGAEHFG